MVGLASVARPVAAGCGGAAAKSVRGAVAAASKGPTQSLGRDGGWGGRGGGQRSGGPRGSRGGAAAGRGGGPVAQASCRVVLVCVNSWSWANPTLRQKMGAQGRVLKWYWASHFAGTEHASETGQVGVGRRQCTGTNRTGTPKKIAPCLGADLGERCGVAAPSRAATTAGVGPPQ